MPPPPYATFVEVSAAADDRTFVLAAQKLAYCTAGRVPPVPATKFFLLRLDPGHGRPGAGATLTTLPIPAIPAGTAVSDFALSPDGSRLAMVSGRPDQQKPEWRYGNSAMFRPNPGAVRADHAGRLDR